MEIENHLVTCMVYVTTLPVAQDYTASIDRIST